MKFDLLGLDVRVWPWGPVFGMDDADWPCDVKHFQEIESACDIPVNEFQLLQPKNSASYQALLGYVDAMDSCNLMAIEISSDILNIRRNGEISEVRQCFSAGNDFKFVGYDICDLDGLFSILNHPVLVAKRGGADLFKEDELFEALELLQLASVLEVEHVPLVVVRISRLK